MRLLHQDVPHEQLAPGGVNALSPRVLKKARTAQIFLIAVDGTGYTDYPSADGSVGAPGKYPLLEQRRIGRTLAEAAAPFRRCLFAIDEFLPYLYNPEGHPRRGEHDLSQAYAHDRSSLGCVLTHPMALCLPAAIEAALGAPPPSPPLVALRYRGAAVLAQDKASASDIDGD